MRYPLVHNLAAENIPVAATCRVLGFTRQAYYAWRKNPISQRDWDDAHLIDAALGIYADDPAFGYRFIADELPEQGTHAGENRVARLCSRERIWSIFLKKRGLNRKAGPPVHDDLVKFRDRTFAATAPDVSWLTDITDVQHRRGQAVPVRDQERLLRPDCRLLHRLPHEGLLAVAALRNAIVRRDPVGTMVRSDQGSQFQSTAFGRTRKSNSLVGSMGRAGARGDNAAVESFFTLLQKNSVDRQRWTTREDLRLAIETWIERSYHRRRRQRRLGRLTPIEYGFFTPPLPRPAHHARRVD